MRLKSKVIFIIIAVLITSVIFLSISPNTVNKIQDSMMNIVTIKPQRQNNLPPFREGERFLYKIKLGRFTAGSAELIFHGRGILDGRDVYIITFEVKLAKFYDKEKIYTLTDSFYPLKVERYIKMFGRLIEITEEYNQNERLVKIQRKERNNTEIRVIQSDKEIQNIISLIYFYRNNQLKEGSISTFNLPTKKIEMRVSKLEEVEVPKGRYKAYLLESIPKQYKVWFDTSKESIPLRIDGVIAFGGAKMVLVEIH